MRFKFKKTALASALLILFGASVSAENPSLMRLQSIEKAYCDDNASSVLCWQQPELDAEYCTDTLCNSSANLGDLIQSVQSSILPPECRKGHPLEDQVLCQKILNTPLQAAENPWDPTEVFDRRRAMFDLDEYQTPVTDIEQISLFEVVPRICLLAPCAPGCGYGGYGMCAPDFILNQK